MTTQDEIKAFEGWCIVELFGHNVIAGYCSERVIAGAAMLQVDVPAVTDRPAFTKLFTSGAIYGLTPTTEEHARVAAERIQARPVTLYILPETQKRLSKSRGDSDPDDWEYERDRDEPDEDDPNL
jgi:hypothetical protein